MFRRLTSRLRGELKAEHPPSAPQAGAEAEFELAHFRPRTALPDAPFGIANSPASDVDDASLVTRLLAAYRFARAQHAGCGDSMWQGFFDAMQIPLDEAFRADSPVEATRLLRDPSSSNHFYGFDNLCAALVHANLSPEAQARSAVSCLAGLMRLSEAMGIVRIWNPEYPAHNRPLASQCAATEDLLATIERHLGVAISFPNPYPKEIGLKTSRGIASYRAVQALYQAWRIKRLVGGLPRPRVLEIGGGLGRTALYSHVLGIADYALVDIPLSAIAQGYFLGRCLGGTAVELVGESSREPSPKIRFLTPQDFLESNERYDLIVNVDSITELAADVAHGYLRKIAASTPLLLSINHEINPETLAGMLATIPNVSDVQRSLYWMRRGYVEEVVQFGPTSAAP